MFGTPLPTDNLYKFLAISGVVIFGLSHYIVWHAGNESISVANKAIQVGNHMLVDQVELQYALVADGSWSAEEAEKNLKTLRGQESKVSRGDTTPNDTKETTKQISVGLVVLAHTPDATEMQKHLQYPWFRAKVKAEKHWTDAQYDMWAAELPLEEFVKMRAPTIERVRTFRDKMDQYASAMDEYELARIAHEQFVSLGRLCVCFGIVLAITGFTLWYRRVQRWQDAILFADYNEKIKT